MPKTGRPEGTSQRVNCAVTGRSSKATIPALPKIRQGTEITSTPGDPAAISARTVPSPTFTTRNSSASQTQSQPAPATSGSARACR